MSTDVSTACQTEIHELHTFFVEWFTGRLPQTEEAFARLTRVLDTGMTLISPAGQVLTQPQLVAWIWEAHNSRADIPFRIWIEKFQVHRSQDGVILATYEEWQAIDGAITCRLSSALFAGASQAPNGLSWLHVHETWIQDGG